VAEERSRQFTPITLKQRGFELFFFSHWLCILMVCSEYMHGMTLQHSFDAVTTKRVKNSLCKGSVEHWNFFQCIGVHVTAILNLSMLRNTRNKPACLHIARPYFFCHSPGTLSNCFVIITHDTCPRYHLQRLLDTSHMDYILGFGPLPTGLQNM